jgi:glycosyltransferase involved in cell wall biosynthesis
MRVWFVNHYAEPPTGMATRPIEIAQRLTEHGFEVMIFASDFDHYRRKYARNLGVAFWREELIGDVRFVWVRSLPYRGNGRDRILNMAAFAALALAAGLLRRGRPDIVVGVTTHPLSGLAGWLLARAKGARFFYEVTDLWPETLIQFGRLRRDSAIARGMRSLERFLYDKAERIIMLWRDTASYVASIGADPGKIVWIPHGVEFARLGDRPLPTVRTNDKLIVMFLGGFNSANAIGTMIQAAEILKARGREDIVMELIGAGVQKERWVRFVQEKALSNVVFPSPVPKSSVPDVMTHADVMLYGLQDLPLYRYGITLNKLFDYLTSRRPIVFYGDASYDPVTEAEAGFVVPPANPVALADAIERIAALTPSERARMGANGYEFLRRHHKIEDLATRYVEIFDTSAPVSL